MVGERSSARRMNDSRNPPDAGGAEGGAEADIDCFGGGVGGVNGFGAGFVGNGGNGTEEVFAGVGGTTGGTRGEGAEGAVGPAGIFPCRNSLMTSSMSRKCPSLANLMKPTSR